jgi:hypothetical protein
MTAVAVNMSWITDNSSSNCELFVSFALHFLMFQDII